MLRTLWAAGFTDEYIGEKIGRTKKAVQRYREKIGLHDENPPKMSKIRAKRTARTRRYNAEQESTQG